RGLFREGRALASDGKYDAACPKFEQSLKLDPGIGTKFNLADCYEHLGRTATARALFLEVATIAREAGQDDREKMASWRARELEPQIHRLTIDVKAKQSGLTIERDGVEVLPSEWGVPQFIDPGAYELRVTAAGKKPWTARIEVPRSGDATVEVPELADADAPKEEPPAPAPEPAKAADRAPTPEQPPPDKPAPDLALPLVIYGGLGASAVLAGTALILYKSANDKAEKICPSGVDCSRQDIQRHQGYVNDARDARTLGYVGLGVAGAALVTGGVIALVRSSHEHPPADARVSAAPVLLPGVYGASMVGLF
ncbi:MAG TPA: tetratricopeptide repeat protein, partial [Polyangiaceae bacterium]|nr:tetratricopeptide repeat protein [Polyangiaceae bacterium]